MTTNKGREIISKINMLLKNAHAENIKIDYAEHNSNILRSRIEVMYSFEIIDNKEHCALPVSRKISVYIEDDEDDVSFNNDFSNENDEKSIEVSENQRNIITSLIGTLSERERDIVENYYGINDKKELTLTDIGKKYNLSSERVRQIKLNAIRKLRSKILLYDDLEDLFV